MRRGDVVTVSLPGDAGKPRPAVIVQVDVLNDDLRSILLCPITSYSTAPNFFRVPVEPTPENGLRLPSEIMVEKLNSANRSKIGSVIGSLGEADINRLNRSLIATLALTEL
jgi:mRNA interferase MazF